MYISCTLVCTTLHVIALFACIVYEVLLLILIYVRNVDKRGKKIFTKKNNYFKYKVSIGSNVKSNSKIYTYIYIYIHGLFNYHILYIKLVFLHIHAHFIW